MWTHGAIIQPGVLQRSFNFCDHCTADTRLTRAEVVVPFAATHKALARHGVSMWKAEMLSNYVMPQVVPFLPWPLPPKEMRQTPPACQRSRPTCAKQLRSGCHHFATCFASSQSCLWARSRNQPLPGSWGAGGLSPGCFFHGQQHSQLCRDWPHVPPCAGEDVCAVLTCLLVRACRTGSGPICIAVGHIKGLPADQRLSIIFQG